MTMGVMPLAPVLGGVLLGTLGGPAAIGALVGASALTALIPTLSRAMRSVPGPSEWERPDQPAATAPVTV